MPTLKATAASTLSLPSENYIYSITSSAPGSFAAISSDDSLRVFDATNIDRISVVSHKAHDGGVTSLRSFPTGDSQLLATGGREGTAKLWDVRAGNAVVELKMAAFPGSVQRVSGNFCALMQGYPGPGLPCEIGLALSRTSGLILKSTLARHNPVLSLACSPETNTIVAGSELVSSQAIVAFWDIRSPQAPRLQYVESHNDDITELQYHPSRSNILLSGSTDGLVNIYDTTVVDEDEALVQVINHGSIHHAGFLSDRTIYALSHDEDFSVHPATDPDEPGEGPEPVQFGDVRGSLDCEYVAQLCIGSQGPYMAAGNKIEKRLDLIPLVSSPTWQFDQVNTWHLPGAHGDEVVRSVYLDEQSQSVFTGGEDGYVRVWKPTEDGEPQSQAGSAKTSRKDKKQKDRYKPY